MEAERGDRYGSGELVPGGLGKGKWMRYGLAGTGLREECPIGWNHGVERVWFC